MPRRQWNDGMEIVFPDLSSASSSLEIELYERLVYELMERQQGVVFGDSFFVSFTNATHISIAAGNGVQADGTQTDPEPKARLLYLPAAVPLAITTAAPTLNRIDLVCVRQNRATILTQSRNKKDATSGVVAPVSQIVETDWLSDTQIVAGTPSGSPVAPATPSGWIAIAQLLVTAVSGIANQAAITDVRPRYKKPSAWSPSKVVTADYVVDLDDSLIVCNPTADMMVTLPIATLCTGKMLTVKNISVHNITVQCQGSDILDGVASQLISDQWTALNIKGDGTQFYLT